MVYVYLKLYTWQTKCEIVTTCQNVADVLEAVFGSDSYIFGAVVCLVSYS